MENLQEAKSGLKKMFIAQIGSVACVVLMLIPLINIIAALATLVFLVLSIVGLYQAGKDIEGCKTAFLLTLANLVVSVLKSFLGIGILGTILTLASAAISLAVIYFVCTSVSEVMTKIGSSDVAKNGHTVWMINLICTAATVLITILALIPVLNVIANFASYIVAIASLVGSVLYMIFLYKSSNAI